MKTKTAISPSAFGFTISNFYNLSNAETLSIWSRYESEDDKRFALESAERIVKVVQDYTSSSLFPLTDKIDLIALSELRLPSSESLGAAHFR